MIHSSVKLLHDADERNGVHFRFYNFPTGIKYWFSTLNHYRELEREGRTRSEIYINCIGNARLL